jgi:hypothetical protein
MGDVPILRSTPPTAVIFTLNQDSERLQKRFPACGAVDAGFTSAVGLAVGLLVVLLEGVVDRQRKAGIHCEAEGGEGPAKTSLKVLLGLLLVAVESTRRSSQFSHLWYEDCAEKLGIEIADSAPQPDVHKI